MHTHTHMYCTPHVYIHVEYNKFPTVAHVQTREEIPLLLSPNHHNLGKEVVGGV